MGLFVKGQKLDSKLLKREKFMLPEGGKDSYVYIRQLSQAERVEFLKEVVRLQEEVEQRKKDGDTSIDVVAAMDVDHRLLAFCIVNDNGEPMYDDAEDVRQNFDVSALSVKKIEERILALSGVDNKDRSAK